MKLQKWAQIAEIVASIALVVTLILLLLQIRTANQGIQIANQQAQSQLNIEGGRISNELPLLSETLQSGLAKAAPAKYDAHRKYLIDRYGMTEEEAWAVKLYNSNGWTNLERWYLRDGPSDGLAEVIRGLAAPRDHRRLLADWKAEGQPYLSPQFWAYVQEALGPDFDWSTEYDWLEDQTSEAD